MRLARKRFHVYTTLHNFFTPGQRGGTAPLAPPLDLPLDYVSRLTIGHRFIGNVSPVTELLNVFYRLDVSTGLTTNM